MYILGIDDGHDSGACIIENGRIKVAINEERLTRKKMYIGFPEKSIKACLDFLGIKPDDIKEIAITSSQYTRTFERFFPSILPKVYAYRRRLCKKPHFEKLRRLGFYFIGSKGTNFILKHITKIPIHKRLKKMGFKNYRLYLIDHHLAHAASAIFTSGFKKSLCITLDGAGDGLSGSINVFENGEIERISSIPTQHSIGMFYEMATVLLGMRELEDGGKLMCLADYWQPSKEEKILDFFEVKGLQMIAKHGPVKRYLELEKILWNCPREKFAYLVQKTLEKNVVKLFQNAIESTGIKNVCWSGGVAANIKLNREIRLNSGLKRWFVFPHMGDGGLAVGAALYVDWLLNGIKPSKLSNVYFGLEYSDEEIEKTLKEEKLHFEYREDVSKLAAELLLKNNIVLWFQGRMEYGPRALGHRSILAPADSLEVKNELNTKIKRRIWYQPFCPSLLVEDAKKVFEDYKNQPDKFMTMAYMSREKIRDKVKAVIHVDGSSRPQMVEKEDKKYRNLLKEIKKHTGIGITLNTSFNIHGEPIVCSPKDAVETMKKTNSKYMIIGNYFVQLRK